MLNWLPLQGPYFPGRPHSHYQELELGHTFFVQLLDCVQLFTAPWTAAHQASLHHLPEFAQTQVHWVGDAIQPPCPPPSLPALNLSQHQGLFQWTGTSHQMVKLLELQLQHQSFQWIFRIDFLSDGLVGSPCSPRDSQESSPTPQFKSINSSALSLPYGPTFTLVHIWT